MWNNTIDTPSKHPDYTNTVVVLTDGTTRMSLIGQPTNSYTSISFKPIPSAEEIRSLVRETYKDCIIAGALFVIGGCLLIYTLSILESKFRSWRAKVREKRAYQAKAVEYYEKNTKGKEKVK